VWKKPVHVSGLFFARTICAAIVSHTPTRCARNP
jgi:hypothetical protein